VQALRGVFYNFFESSKDAENGEKKVDKVLVSMQVMEHGANPFFVEAEDDSDALENSRYFYASSASMIFNHLEVQANAEDEFHMLVIDRDDNRENLDVIEEKDNDETDPLSGNQPIRTNMGSEEDFGIDDDLFTLNRPLPTIERRYTG